jgi:hypothetical protein
MSMAMSRVLGLAIGLVGCNRPQDAPVSPNFSVEPCKLSQMDICTPPDCAPNSPATNTFPINGLSMDGRGECNQAHIQLIPQSLSGGGCRSGADLTLDKASGKLVGKRGGSQVCAGQELAGATFTVRSLSATAVFTIANVREFQVQGKPYEGVRIESGGESMCEPAVAQRVLHELGFGRRSPRQIAQPAYIPDGFAPGFDDDLVIPLGGPIFDQIKEVGRTIADTEGRFFNLACVGDALAKLTLDGLNFPSEERTETALRMLTASYCGKPLTVRGINIEWFAADRPVPHEASWRARKAGCIDTPRLMKLHVNGQPVAPQDLPRELQPEHCYDESQGHGVCDETAWIEALRTQCRVPACGGFSGGDLESYLHEDPSKLRVVKPKP